MSLIETRPDRASPVLQKIDTELAENPLTRQVTGENF
jgi:hypothetical protein